MTYTATDNQDGATATAKYVLTVHDAEERQRDTVDDPHYLYKENKGANVANNSGEPETVALHTDLTHINVESSTYGGTIGADWLKDFGINVSGTAAWGTQVWNNDTTGASFSCVLQPGQYIYAITIVFAHHEEFPVSSYDTGGFTGQASEFTNTLDGDQSIEYTTSAVMSKPGWMIPK